MEIYVWYQIDEAGNLEKQVKACSRLYESRLYIKPTHVIFNNSIQTGGDIAGLTVNHNGSILRNIIALTTMENSDE